MDMACDDSETDTTATGGATLTTAEDEDSDWETEYLKEQERTEA